MKSKILALGLIVLALGFSNGVSAKGQISLHQMTAAQGGGYHWFVNGEDLGPCTTSYIPAYVTSYANTQP